MPTCGTTTSEGASPPAPEVVAIPRDIGHAAERVAQVVHGHVVIHQLVDFGGEGHCGGHLVQKVLQLSTLVGGTRAVFVRQHFLRRLAAGTVGGVVVGGVDEAEVVDLQGRKSPPA